MDDKLEKAIANGDELLVRNLLTIHKIQPNFSMLQTAYFHKRFDVARVLFDSLKSYDNVRVRDWILEAASEGDLDTVRLIVRKGPDIDTQTKGDAFIYAARAGYIAIVKYLFAQKFVTASVWQDAIRQAAKEKQDDTVKYLLFEATTEGYNDVVKNFLNANPTLITEKDNIRYDVLSLAARNGNLELFEYMYRSHKYSANHLHDMVEHAAVADRRNILDFLFSKEVRENLSFKQIPNTAWITILRARHLKTIKMLIENGYKVHPSLERYVLNIARKGDYAGIYDLLEAGFDIQWNDNALLKDAVEARRLDVTRFLLDKGANANSALEIASRDNLLDMIRILLDSGTITQASLDAALVKAADYARIDAVKLLLKHGADINTDNGKPLMAVIYSRISDVDFDESSNYLNRYNIVKYMIENNADVTLNNDEALYRAAFRGEINIMKLLLKHGAHVDRILNMQTLSIVLRENAWKAARYIINKGVYPFIEYNKVINLGLDINDHTTLNTIVAQKVVVTELIKAIYERDVGAITKNLDYAPNVPLRLETIGTTLIKLANDQGEPDIAKHFIDYFNRHNIQINRDEKTYAKDILFFHRRYF